VGTDRRPALGSELDAREIESARAQRPKVLVSLTLSGFLSLSGALLCPGILDAHHRTALHFG
jgi:hypothetical protein